MATDTGPLTTVGNNDATLAGDSPTALAGMDPGMLTAAQQVAAGLAATTAANHQSQVESARFIMESGADVLGGHAPVNSPTGAFLSPGGVTVDDAGID